MREKDEGGEGGGSSLRLQMLFDGKSYNVDKWIDGQISSNLSLQSNNNGETNVATTMDLWPILCSKNRIGGCFSKITVS